MYIYIYIYIRVLSVDSSFFQVGKPGGADTGFFAQSWGVAGAVSYDDTHLSHAAWGACPSGIDDV